MAGAATIAFCVRALWPVMRPAGWLGRVGTIAFALSSFGLGDLLSPLERLGCRLTDAGRAA